MKYELFNFQKMASIQLLKKINDMQDDTERHGSLSAISLTAPTGSGKTVISASTIEGLFYGNENIESDSKATVLWLSDSPSLNKQTIKSFSKSSDMLDPSTSMKIIGSEFALNHDELNPGVIYFINRQLLSKRGILVNGNEGNRTFYDILTNTIEDKDIHLYLFIDEAHRGLGMDTQEQERESKTIYAKLIDGQKDINPPMPIVIGISATSKRFENAMNGRINRDMKAPINVPIKEVRESGLIKETIELRSPKDKSKSLDIDLVQSCKRFVEMTNLWEEYCKIHGIQIVQPLMVVQVEDRISDISLGNICHKISKIVPKLDNKKNFANVFGEHNDIITDFANIDYISPDEVNNNTDIKILFAKDAISTGWDCPRAEVIYSQRSRKDSTYIAQLIGRMIRNPLAHHIDKFDDLNTVACYLPDYDDDSVNEIVDQLENDSAISTKEVLANPAKVSWFGNQKQNLTSFLMENSNKSSNSKGFNKNKEQNFINGTSDESEVVKVNSNSKEDDEAIKGISHQSRVLESNSNDKENETIKETSNDLRANENMLENVKGESISNRLENFPKINNEDMEGIKKAFESVISRTVSYSKSDSFRNLFDAVDIIMMDIDPDSDLNSKINVDFYNKIEGEIVTYPEEFGNAFTKISSFSRIVKRVDPLTGKIIESREDLVSNDLESSINSYTDAIRRFSGISDIVNDYINRYSTLNSSDSDMAVLRFTAVANCIEIMNELKDWAKLKTDKLVDDYNPQRYAISTDNISRWETIVGNTKHYIETNLNIMAIKTSQDKKFKAYPKHIFCDEDGLAFLKLNDVEDSIVNNELCKPLNIAWYRNNARSKDSSLSIPYLLGNKWKNMYPDFIFFQKTRDGRIVPIIVDPHGDWLGDSVAKLKGYIKYLKDYPNEFGLVQAVADRSDGSYRYLDLLDIKVQKAIIDFSGDTAQELFNGPFGKDYKITKL